MRYTKLYFQVKKDFWNSSWYWHYSRGVDNLIWGSWIDCTCLNNVNPTPTARIWALKSATPHPTQMNCGGKDIWWPRCESSSVHLTHTVPWHKVSHLHCIASNKFRRCGAPHCFANAQNIMRVACTYNAPDLESVVLTFKSTLLEPRKTLLRGAGPPWHSQCRSAFCVSGAAMKAGTMCSHVNMQTAYCAYRSLKKRIFRSVIPTIEWAWWSAGQLTSTECHQLWLLPSSSSMKRRILVFFTFS